MDRIWDIDIYDINSEKKSLLGTNQCDLSNCRRLMHTAATGPKKLRINDPEIVKPFAIVSSG